MTRLEAARAQGLTPSRSTASPRVDVNSFLARVEAIAVVIAADTDGTVTLARPGVEDAPAAVSADVLTALARIGRRRLRRLTAWLRRRDRAGLACHNKQGIADELGNKLARRLEYALCQHSLLGDSDGTDEGMLDGFADGWPEKRKEMK